MSKPLIKWPGGKRSEIGQFLSLIPDFDRYIEPFAGGAALFFYLRPQRAVLGDTSPYLMDFYKMVQRQDPAFKRLLNLYDRTFSALREQCEKNYTDLRTIYKLYEYADKEEMSLDNLDVHGAIVEKIAMTPEVLSELVADEDEFYAVMSDSVEDKMRRTVINNKRKPLSEKDLKENLITGFLSGYYLYFRDVFNQIAAGKMISSVAYKVANYYFIREYCYGSMFRYNRKGEFNIPYGGISYNKKELSGKMNRIFSDSTARLMERTDLYCEDFETLMGRLELTERDFLFLDPPYDTEFSEYDGQEFGHNDQKRLAEFLYKTKAKFLLVIKNTEYIYSLYEGRFRILAFENQYLYNVRSRNERKAEHLIITNIPEGEVPWIRENF